MAAWHRSNGQYTIGLLVAHTLLITWGYAEADSVSIGREAGKLLRSYPDVLAATVGLGLLIAVAATSVRAARRRLRYETWYFIHLYTYLAIALAFSHQLATGNEFTTHQLYRALWVLLYVAVFGLLLVFRVAVPIRDAFRYQLRVASIQEEGGHPVSMGPAGTWNEWGRQRASSSAGDFWTEGPGGRPTPSHCRPHPTAASCGSPPRGSEITAPRWAGSSRAPGWWPRVPTGTSPQIGALAPASS